MIEYIPCGFQHEKSAQGGDILKVHESVKMCTLRLLGNNLACAHIDMFFGDEKNTVYMDLKNKIIKIGDVHTLEVYMNLNSLKHIIDDLVRASYSKGSWYALRDIPETFQQNPEIVSILNQMEQILQNCGILGENKKPRMLNPGERNRFNFLIQKFQNIIGNYYDDLLTKLKEI
ncbi:hypothetical protein LAT59_04145 [Candidatus Gracilibacteria bacterium]|nr:hypothetical protein [Candidatus Gracilibacteria bacterium]